ncbi:MAG: hypothetical protein IKP28_04265 [Clostridia bacterium]|nr:hypothetical protein [Clostridia bacterium]
MIQEKIKALVKQQKEKSDKKNIENLIVFLIILIVTVIAINTILGDDDKKDEAIDESTKMSSTIELNEETSKTQDSLEDKLKNILSKIEGVGNVDVLVTYSTTSETVAMYNENQKESSTEETDTGGGTRKITETDNSKEIVFKDENGYKIPVTTKTILPKLEGAIIIAQGAKNADIKANIIQAVEAATGLATHKIQVFAMQL